MSVRLSAFRNPDYTPGRSVAWQALWFFLGLPILRSHFIPFSGCRTWVLRVFGARVGKGVVIKPGVRVKFPWRLSVGDDCWIGEDAWIDNLAQVTIGNDVCISQAAYLCTGNHDWRDPAFGLSVRPIRLGDGCWVGARTTVGPGVLLGDLAIASMGSVVYHSIPAGEIHSGNPAEFRRARVMREQPPPLKPILHFRNAGHGNSSH